MKITFNNSINGTASKGYVELSGSIPPAVIAALYDAIAKLSPNNLAEFDAPEPDGTVETIHPYDLAELLDQEPKQEIIYGLVTFIGNKAYRQSTAVPQKGNKYR